MAKKKIHDTLSYGRIAIPHLEELLARNSGTMERVASRLARDVTAGRSLFAFGSGHSAIFAMEVYHRAGGASFVIPLVADYLLPSAGPPVVRVFERTPGAANALLSRAQPAAGEMLWIASQSGINGAVVDFALAAKREYGLRTVAFTSIPHSSAVKSRHPSGKRLFEVCDEVLDLGGVVGDACVPLGGGVMAGPLSTLGATFLAHSVLVAACARLEAAGTRCVYTSVNTPEGEKRNRALERRAAARDVLLR
jgi:uncharacterized phosphosugar-binding protein